VQRCGADAEPDGLAVVGPEHRGRLGGRAGGVPFLQEAQGAGGPRRGEGRAGGRRGQPPMNPYVASPHWEWYIVAYFYLGGIAAGAYAVAAMVGLWGKEDDREAVRVAHYIAFPLVTLCGLILTVDLGHPERFWHMLIQSETYWPMFKWWSPMSA